jgi:chorismate mutase
MSTVWFTTGSSRRAGQLLGQNQELRAGSIKYFMQTTPLVLAIITLFAGHINAGTQEQLAPYRQQIDSLDQRTIELLQQRARVIQEVGNVKREAHLPVTVPSREQQVIEKAQELAKGGPLPAEAVGRILSETGRRNAQLGSQTRCYSVPII